MYFQKSRKVISVEQELSSKGAEFRQMVAKETDISPDQLKLISSGKVIVDQQTLQEQGVKVSISFQIWFTKCSV